MNNFWYFKEGKVGISHLNLKLWFESEGIYRHYIDSKQWILVEIKNKIIREIENSYPKNLCLNYLLNIHHEEEPEKIKVYEFLCQKSDHYFGKGFYEILDSTRDIPDFYIMKDTDKHSFKYFRNCVVIVDKKGIKEIPHSKLFGHIWEGQLIDRDWTFGKSDTVFEKFLNKVSGEKKEKLNAFRSIIGYYLWTYKNPSLSPCIALTDEVISSNACGRTGKGLFFKAISQIIKTITFPKNFDINKTFCFQRVTLDTQLVVLEDIPKRFDFEKLFTVITEGMIIEQLYKGEVWIPFDDSAKFAITTNYALQGSTDSFKARLKEIELTKYFSADYRPEHEFKHLFFKQWDEKEWSKFDNFMVGCIIYFMKNGFVEVSNQYYEYKKVMNMCGTDVYEWLEDCLRNHWYVKSELKDTFRRLSDYKNLGSQKILEMITSYCNLKGLELIEGRKSDQRSIMLKEKEYDLPKPEPTQAELALEKDPF